MSVKCPLKCCAAQHRERWRDFIRHFLHVLLAVNAGWEEPGMLPLFHVSPVLVVAPHQWQSVTQRAFDVRMHVHHPEAHWGIIWSEPLSAEHLNSEDLKGTLVERETAYACACVPACVYWRSIQYTWVTAVETSWHGQWGEYFKTSTGGKRLWNPIIRTPVICLCSYQQWKHKDDMHNV